MFWQPVRTGCGINKLPEVQESASDQVATVSDSLGLCFIVSGSIIEGKKAKNEDSLGTSKETNLHRAVHCIPLDTHKCSYRIVEHMSHYLDKDCKNIDVILESKYIKFRSVYDFFYLTFLTLTH